MTDKEKFKKLLNELNIEYTEKGKYIVINNFYVNSIINNKLCIAFNDYDFENEAFQSFYIF